jgi:hypothetical protein
MAACAHDARLLSLARCWLGGPDHQVQGAQAHCHVLTASATSSCFAVCPGHRQPALQIRKRLATVLQSASDFAFTFTTPPPLLCACSCVVPPAGPCRWRSLPCHVLCVCWPHLCVPILALLGIALVVEGLPLLHLHTTRHVGQLLSAAADSATQHQSNHVHQLLVCIAAKVVSERHCWLKISTLQRSSNRPDQHQPATTRALQPQN